MKAYFGGLEIYEVLGYARTSEEMKELMGEQYAMVRFGSEEGTPFIVRTDEIEISD